MTFQNSLFLALEYAKIYDRMQYHSYANLTLKFFVIRYIYGGILSLNEQDVSDILKVLTAADELSLQEIVDYLQKYLIESKSE